MTSMMNIGGSDSPEIVRECKRKKPYPTEASAKEAAAQASKDEGIPFNHFKCRHGNHFHIGKTLVYTVDPNYKFMVRFDNVLWAKIRIQADQWLFMCPPGTPEIEEEILVNGHLVAHKELMDCFKTVGGLRARHSHIFNQMPTIYPANPTQIKEDILKMQMITQDSAMEKIAKNGYAATNGGPKRIIITPPEIQKEKELYKGKEVFRTPEGRPFLQDRATCSVEGCSNVIELRAYITTGKEGQLNYVYGRVPLDGKAIRKEGSSKQFPLWICKECVKKERQQQPVSEPQEVPIRIDGSIIEEQPVKRETPAYVPPAETAPALGKNHVLLDLQRIASDQSIDPLFVKGATLMACDILLGMNP